MYVWSSTDLPSLYVTSKSEMSVTSLIRKRMA
jgi:hypothetical protein